MDSEKFSQLVVKNKTKIVFIVIDGLGGLPSSTSATAKSELEVARLPHVDALARESDLGLQKPLEEYMTVGSSAGHLALFGYDPLQYRVGRGIVEAIGLKIKVTDHDIMARGNWAKCDYGASGITVRDRRAGRIETRLAKKLAHKINKEIKNCDNAIVTLHQSVSHRFVAQFRFPYAITGDMARLSDSDPLRDDETVKPVKGLSGSAEEIAKVVNHFLEETYVLLHNEKNANGLTLRGFSTMPQMPSFDTLYQLKAACIAYYPMYLGLAQLLGMKVIAQKKDDTKEQCALLKKNFSKYDFFFLHFKKTDLFGENADFKGKVDALEQFDHFVPLIQKLKPDVLVITGDHSTPARMGGHSWHPVPFLIHSRNTYGAVKAKEFSEVECRKGMLGILPSLEIMPLVLSHAGRLKKFGA